MRVRPLLVCGSSRESDARREREGPRAVADRYFAWGRVRSEPARAAQASRHLKEIDFPVRREVLPESPEHASGMVWQRFAGSVGCVLSLAIIASPSASVGATAVGPPTGGWE